MHVAIQLARSLREYARCEGELHCTATTIAEALRELHQQYPAVYQSICDETGAVRRHIHLFVNSRWISAREPQGLAAPLSEGDIVTIFTAVSGG